MHEKVKENLENRKLAEKLNSTGKKKKTEEQENKVIRTLNNKSKKARLDTKHKAKKGKTKKEAKEAKTQGSSSGVGTEPQAPSAHTLTGHKVIL